MLVRLVLIFWLASAARRGFHPPRTAREKTARGIFKEIESFVRWAKRHGPQKPVTIHLKHEPGMPKAEFRRKANALKKLGDEGKLFKFIEPHRLRDTARRNQHRGDLIGRIRRQYAHNPDFRDRLIDRITNGSMQLDHRHELQLAGPDLRYNLRFLDSTTNNAIGRQIREQIYHLPTGTPIRIKIL
ncbi:hypothetical protein [Actinomadura rupiterrae]|uniref:hypothetical protein n=1 Tax=Actinomadura rupiterrae TaxID=559627 RepID=UPI0020A26E88|nr:hypothetical protein [Actinomadura rupiterrae]MCP2343639.1 hypothetical protein [Actinomadura rupiterrae]